MSRRSVFLVSFLGTITVLAIIAAAFVAGQSTATRSLGESAGSDRQANNDDPSSALQTRGRTAAESLFYPPERLGIVIASSIANSVQIECQDGYGTGWVYDTPHDPTFRNAEFEAGSAGMQALVVTAKHVIDKCRTDPSTIAVLLDSQEVGSQLLNWQKETDLATIAIDASIPGLPGSEDVKAGMWALAIGWPFNYSLTPTVGRVIEIADSDLYIDVLVEPGNSGGPLIDSTGAVIGTVTASFLDDQDVTTGYNIATKTRALCTKLLLCSE